MHDFAITENYALFMDLPVMIKPELMMTDKIPIVFDKNAGARRGIRDGYVYQNPVEQEGDTIGPRVVMITERRPCENVQRKLVFVRRDAA